MVKFVSAQGYSSPFSGAIERAASTLWGDTLTPALKREQLLKAQRENAGAQNMMDLFRDVGGAAARRSRPVFSPGGAGPITPPPAPSTVPQDIAGDTMIALGHAQPKHWLRYDNQGATRNQALSPHLVDALSFFPDMGLSMEVFSGGQPGIDEGGPRVGSTRHDHGDAADAFFYKDGRRLDWANPDDVPIFQDIVARGRAAGITGFGAGDGYMQPGSMHIGFGPEAVWGADGSGANAPDWLTAAFGGQYMPPATPSGMDGAPATDGTYNPLNAPQFYGELAARAVEGGMDPGDAADLARLFMAGTFGAENQATTDAFVGAGGNYADTYNGFAADQNRMERDSVRDDSTSRRGQDLDFDLGREKISTESEDRRYNTDQDNATKLTLDDRSTIEVLRDGVPRTILKSEMLPTDEAIISDAERKGIEAGRLGMTRDETRAYVGAEPKNPPQADSYVDSAGTVYRSYDGVNTTDGQPLPPDALKTSVVSADRASAGLDKINERNTEAQVLSGQKFKGTVSRAREVAIAAGPTAFGIIGRARSLGQDVQAAFEAAGQAFGGDIEAVVASTESDLRARADSGDTVAKTFFANEYDPNITRLEMYTRLLPYEAASAIADQTGRGLSDNDVKRFQQIVGDPLAFFGTQQAFLTTLDTIEQEVDARLAANRATLEGGRDAVPPPQQPAPATGQPPQISTDEEYDALPSGSEFIAPDGSRRRKP